MTAPAPEVCDVCGASPVEMVLYPVAIHYKGSGFYSTDYGKGKAAKAKEAAGSGGGDSGSSSSSGSDSGGSSDTSSSTGSSEKKAATSD
jgi:predicted nucleic acid-binding Zn ribbon protein